jgi:flagellar biosynthesis component FlhA
MAEATHRRSPSHRTRHRASDFSPGQDRDLGEAQVRSGLAIGIMAILVVLILPLPTWLLDVCLAFSLSFDPDPDDGGVHPQKPLEFSAFPTILLITTMMRLALNLASTRLILGHGNEGTAASGYVIQAFGKLIMQGNFVIGLIVFAILIIVNFVVITKGSGRIAEVAARFTLDAMPGKQMAIDADLSAGLIDEKRSQAAPQDLEAESNSSAPWTAPQIRARRRHRRPDDRGHQHRRRHHHRRGPEGHELRRRHPDLHPADRR